MNQIDTGKFIAKCRKEKGLTQAQLAEKLNITDRAVSKWETGKSMPDSSIMLELCGILGITVNELLSGERIEMSNYEEKVSENLIELTRKDENNMKKNTVISIVYTIIMAISGLICCICDLAITGTLTWALIALSSILFTWIITFPVVLSGKSGIPIAMAALTIFIFPFLYLLGRLLNTGEIFRIGAIMSIITLVFMWGIFYLFYRLKNRKLLATGIAFLATVPFTLIINFVLAGLIGSPAVEIWDMFSVFILLIIGVACIMKDNAQKKGYVK